MLRDREDRLRELNLVLEWDENRDYRARANYWKGHDKKFSRNHERQEFTEEAQCIPNGTDKNNSITMHLPLKF